MFGLLGGSEMIVILLVATVFFGAKKLPELARGLGQGIREFKKATSEVTQDIEQSVYSDPPPAPRRLPKQAPDSVEATVAPPPKAEAPKAEAAPKEAGH